MGIGGSTCGAGARGRERREMAGRGGDGGVGGRIVARIDSAAFDEIASVLDLDTPGGNGGYGGPDGAGGAGGGLFAGELGKIQAMEK